VVQSGRLQAGCVFFGNARQQFLDFGNGSSRVQALRTRKNIVTSSNFNKMTNLLYLGARPGAVHDRVAPIHAERILQLVQTRRSRFITRIDDPAIGLHQHSRAQILVTIPPVRWTRRGTAGAQDALVQTVQFGAVVHGLEVLGSTLLFSGLVSRGKKKD
jgi:hypothetical protein